MNKLPHHEAQAMLLDRYSVLCVVSALRRYRAAVEKLLSLRYRDGECDGNALANLQDEAEAIEAELKEES